MKAPQIIMICLFAVSFTINCYQHGKPSKPKKWWYDLMATAIMVGLLWWGGFWK
jgi:hypothetical protein